MKRKMAFLVGLLLFFAASNILAGDQKKELSPEQAKKSYCVTWINNAYNESAEFTAKKIMNVDGTFRWYNNETSESPKWQGTFDIEKSWIDDKGNVWLYMIYDYVIVKKFTVAKISDNGNLLEQVYSFDAYPTEVNSDDTTYFFMYKK